MFCKHCGSQINDNARFCSGCGNPVMNQAKYTTGTMIFNQENDTINA
ncbi:zinc-ribbon domain-containing protein, partial [Acidithiobacillus sp.]